jgi:dihydrofolate reductase
MIISIIAAVAKNNTIGFKNKLPWKLPNDLQHFKKITMGHYVVMGQRTYESLGRPLVGRKNIILSFNKDYKAEGCITANSLEEALKTASFDGEGEVFVIGGASVYKQAIGISDKLYITKINRKFKGDTSFPEINRKEWKLVFSEEHKKGKNDPLPYCFTLYERRKS